METGIIRNELGQFIEGVSGNPDGRTPMTQEEKIVKKATKEFIAEFKEGLAKALPLISPVLIAKALDGDMQAIKEVNDRAMGKAEQHTDLTTNGKDIPAPIINVQRNNSISEDKQSN